MANEKNGYSAVQITSKIIETPYLRDMCLEFSDMLDTQGIYRWFIREEKLDELLNLLNSLEVMTGEFSQLHINSETLRKNNDANIIRQIAQKLCALRFTTNQEIVSGTENIISLWKTSKHAPDLFLAICDLGVKLRRVYQNAVDRFVQKKVREGMFIVPQSGEVKDVTEFWESLTKNKNSIVKAMDEALPLGIEDVEDSLKWMKEHGKIYMLIDFFEAMQLTDFENTYYSFFGDKTTSASAMPREIVEKEVERIFKALLLNDVFESCPRNKRTKSKINDEIKSMVQERSLRIKLRYVQAFFMFYREDSKRAKELTKEIEDCVRYDSSTYGDKNTPRFPS